MPISFRFRPEAGLITCVHTGQVPDSEFLTSYRELFGSESFSTSTNLLVDLSDTDSSSRTRDTLERFASLVELRFKDAVGAPMVAVVAPKDLSFGLARMYEAFAESVPWKFAVFRSAGDALDWLGAPEQPGDA